MWLCAGDLASRFAADVGPAAEAAAEEGEVTGDSGARHDVAAARAALVAAAVACCRGRPISFVVRFFSLVVEAMLRQQPPGGATPLPLPTAPVIDEITRLMAA